MGGHSSSQKNKWCPTKINNGVNRCPWAIDFANACYSLLAGGDGFVEGGTGLTGCREKSEEEFWKVTLGMCVL